MIMTTATHDTFADLDAGTPQLFIWVSRALPVILLAQFFFAGQALFAGAAWDAHIAIGGLAALPILFMLGYALGMKRLRGFGWWAGALTILYVIQVVLAAGSDSWLQVHPLNAALLLTASIVFSFKVERRRAASNSA